MVRVSSVLSRIPVIKFRKGGLAFAGHSANSGGHAAPPSAASSAASSPHVQAAAGMSTSVIPDTDLPPRYKRMPLSQEEIDYINGGGIV